MLNGENPTMAHELPDTGATGNGNTGSADARLELYLKGTYSRSGDDLVISGRDDARILIEDYFEASELPSISLPGGGVLVGSLVGNLLQNPLKGALAQADAPLPENAIGEVATLDGVASVQRGGVLLDLNVGDAVFQNDVMITAESSTLGIGFIDGTVFTLSSDARMVLDELVYQPGGESNSMAFNLLHGTFVFVAGQVAKTGEMEVETPVVTMGIRGTTPLVWLDALLARYEYGIIPDPNGDEGAYVLRSKETGDVIGIVDQVGVRYRVGQDGEFEVIPNNEADQAEVDELSELMYAIYNQVQALNIQTRSIDEGNSDDDTGNQAPANDSSPNDSQIEIDPLNDGDLNDLLDDDDNSSGSNSGTGDQTFLEDQGNIVPDGVIPAEEEEVSGLVFVNGTSFVQENSTLTDGNLAPAGTSFVYELVEGSAPEPGTLTVNPDGTFTYDTGEDFDVLMEGQTAEVTFQYTVTDPETGEVSAPQTATIIVTGIDDPAEIGVIAEAETGETEEVSIPEGSSVDLSLPVSDPDSIFLVTITAGSTVTLDQSLLAGFQAAGLITFSEGDGNADEVMTFTTSGPVLEELLDTFTYQPSENFSGTGIVTVSITEVINGTADPSTTEIRKLEIEVINEYDPPEIGGNPDGYTVESNSILDFSEIADDPISVSDPDPGEIIRVFLLVNEGALLVGSVVDAVTYDPDGETGPLSSLTLSGEVDAVNEALSMLIYQPAGPGDGFVLVQISDGQPGGPFFIFPVDVVEPSPLHIHYDDASGEFYTSDGQAGVVTGETDTTVTFTSDNQAFLDSIGTPLVDNGDGSYSVDYSDAEVSGNPSILGTFLSGLVTESGQSVNIFSYDSEETGAGNNIVGTSDTDVTTGTEAPDIMSGFEGDDILSGAGGNDVIAGGAGSDTLSGNDGADYLDGGLDFDILSGGANADTFIGSDLQDGIVDRILDYSGEEGDGDVIDVSTLLDQFFGPEHEFTGEEVILQSDGADSTLLIQTGEEGDYQAVFELTGVGAGSTVDVIFQNGGELMPVSSPGL